MKTKEPSEALLAARLDVKLWHHILQQHRRAMVGLMAAIKTQTDLEFEAAGRPERLTTEQVRNVFCELLELNPERTIFQ